MVFGSCTCLFQRCPQSKFKSFPFILHSYTTKLGLSTPSHFPSRLLFHGESGRSHHACRLFDQTPERSSVAFSPPISAKCRHGDAGSAVALFRPMHASFGRFDERTYTELLGACSTVDIGKQVHAVSIKECCECVTVFKTSLVSMYCKFGSTNDALRVFEEIRVKDVVCWNAMLTGLVRNGHEKNCVLLFQEMQKAGFAANGFSFSSVLKACSCLSALELGKQIHGHIIVSGCYSFDLLVLGTALVDFYCKCSSPDEACKVFHEFDGPKDIVLYNSIISGFVHNKKYSDAFLVFRSLEKEPLKPNRHTMATLLDACSGISCLLWGEEIHGVVIKGGFGFDIVLNNALIDMYSKGGKIQSARTVFDRMPWKNVISWTSIIDAYGSHGDGIEALCMFENMVESGVSPNSVTLLSVISACSHSGMVDEGRRYFWSMKENFGVVQGPEHFASLIDLLGRGGHVDEAWDLVCSMPVEPNPAVCVSLLNACQGNQDVLRAELVAEMLLKLQVEKPAHYVLLSNLYASIGRWDDAETLRRIIKMRGLRKVVGSSWIEIDR
ncbi:pentatricopeptide repeat-containing protein At5g66500, mitochondrial-like isoform X1 [Nymphaea colorata]|nr:pentatricopeptide repeat-containing protein At5g66500, mitochondrial-like isoform X1 [Nymphaea colorata]XP_031491867.1 pentatricopeptide repeat-containing protein At5g66500, mitochondrial-like isoform X1 [Nymphaea colorata]XP_031491868.1 pentatricopeptide repeat-containing protein At5g66500, mitochondrial-like isoform X1 [Nymphaea colorata]XP_031491869.1 pentatricopeptide repeat-containing protein At5g66500, mitochondrial-like isoform X1 [Nymphaea colorata]XP_031491871.1 pentatricopeptide re